MVGSVRRSKSLRIEQNKELQSGGSRTVPHCILLNIRREQKKSKKRGTTALYILKLSLCVLWGLEKMNCKRDTPKGFWLELRGEGRERGNLIDLNHSRLAQAARRVFFCDPFFAQPGTFTSFALRLCSQ